MTKKEFEEKCLSQVPTIKTTLIEWFEENGVVYDKWNDIYMRNNYYVLFLEDGVFILSNEFSVSLTKVDIQLVEEGIERIKDHINFWIRCTSLNSSFSRRANYNVSSLKESIIRLQSYIELYPPD